MMTFENHWLFCHLPNEAVARLTKQAREQQFAAGQDIFSEGDPGDGLYCLKSGVVDIFHPTPDGQRRVFAQVMPGDIFGEMAVLDALPRSASAAARVDCAVWFVPRESVLCLIEESPELAVKFMREISRRLRELSRQPAREAA